MKTMIPEQAQRYIDAAKVTAEKRQTWLRLLATFPRTSEVKRDLDDVWNMLQFAMDEEWAANWDYHGYVRSCETEQQKNPLFDPTK